ncbi:hypothetical protein [Ructibacterium gallinarum]|uniref:Uncharacterized protein n=1 Tax=Ructibacterium gallinarum TaxID=2779355 RepID=A0A9D5LYV7_9FIRM|nr:hypothetical protein [Ructibacterium gallinarum]MBE5039442.1 hypothetical protein [Ructibacterium gallinarum]
MASTNDTPAKKSNKPKKDASQQQDQLLTYHGKPLVRCGNIIYYGKPEDKYVVTFRLEDQEPLGDLQISKRVIIELKTNEGKHSQLIRQAERSGLYKAFDIGMFWLEQALENG